MKVTKKCRGRTLLSVATAGLFATAATCMSDGDSHVGTLHPLHATGLHLRPGRPRERQIWREGPAFDVDTQQPLAFGYQHTLGDPNGDFRIFGQCIECSHAAIASCCGLRAADWTVGAWFCCLDRLLRGRKIHREWEELEGARAACAGEAAGDVPAPAPAASKGGLNRDRDRDFLCPVCMERVPVAETQEHGCVDELPCGHQFCRRCLTSWHVQRHVPYIAGFAPRHPLWGVEVSTCPTCRAPFTGGALCDDPEPGHAWPERRLRGERRRARMGFPEDAYQRMSPPGALVLAYRNDRYYFDSRYDDEFDLPSEDETDGQRRRDANTSAEIETPADEDHEQEPNTRNTLRRRRRRRHVDLWDQNPIRCE